MLYFRIRCSKQVSSFSYTVELQEPKEFSFYKTTIIIVEVVFTMIHTLEAKLLQAGLWLLIYLSITVPPLSVCVDPGPEETELSLAVYQGHSQHVVGQLRN